MEKQAATEQEEPKSKSQIKREYLAYQALGKQLVELPNKQLAKLPLSESLRESIVEAKPLKHSALSRQFKYIGSLMPDEEVASIQSALEALKKPHKEQTEAFHQLEQWRDQLLKGDKSLMGELANKFEGFEHQYVNQLVRNAKKERESNKPPKSARLLFQYLSKIQDVATNI